MPRSFDPTATGILLGSSHMLIVFDLYMPQTWDDFKATPLVDGTFL